MFTLMHIPPGKWNEDLPGVKPFLYYEETV
jgi:hypothetical protein